VRLLLDTQIVLWATLDPRLLSSAAFALMNDRGNSLVFSAVTIWEVAIKFALGRSDFDADPRVLRRALLDNGYAELPITGQHAVTIASLPPLHKDPFDRLLLAQAMSEGITLLTADARLAQYPGPVRLV
jgi:PIN domain nuclease of toxin-antitoxin system